MNNWQYGILAVALCSALTACSSDDKKSSGVTPTPTCTGDLPTEKVALTGVARFARIPHASNGLAMNNAQIQVARGVTVELLRACNDSVVATVSSDANGAYSFNAPKNTSYKLRVRAELKKTSAPSWTVQVLDNTKSNALYTYTSGSVAVAEAAVSQDLLLGNGWTGQSYTQTRNAAPFAILDTLYTGLQAVNAALPAQNLPALNVYWSLDNAPVYGDDNFTDGQIGASQYRSDGIYLLGKADSNTDEFDPHMVLQPFAHFLLAQLSRDTAPAGRLAADTLHADPRRAFRDAFAMAFSAWVLNDGVLRDSYGATQSQSLINNLASTSVTGAGWAQSRQLAGLLFQLQDNVAKPHDTVALPRNALISALTATRDNDALLTAHAYLRRVKDAAGDQAVALNTLLTHFAVNSNVDDFAGGETFDGGSASNLPIYRTLLAGAPVADLCSVKSDGSGAGLGVRRFVRYQHAAEGNLSLRAQADDLVSNPLITVWRRGVSQSPALGNDEAETGVENWQASVPAGDYIIEVAEANNVDATAGNERVRCMTLSIN